MTKSQRPARIAIAWKGLPDYGARAIRAALDRASEPVAVIGTRANVPVQGIDEAVAPPISWVDDGASVSWEKLGLVVPRVFFQTSWVTPAFNALARQVKHSGGKVICLHDNRLKRNVRQAIGALYYRLAMRRRYDAAWAPGESGRQFCRFLGVPDADIYQGLYSGWTELFTPGPSLELRPPRVLFVGQYIARKGLDALATAWGGFSGAHPEWELHTYGQGPLEALLRSAPRTLVRGFAAPSQIAAAMREARYVIMPSRNDHWGVAVHEAASSGCGLLLSENVGSRLDLANPQNALVFPPDDPTALTSALHAAAAKSEDWLRDATSESVRLASHFSPARFAQTFWEICDRFLPR